MRIVPVRAACVLAATVKLTVPLAVPELPDVMVIQASEVVAVHAQPLGAVTAIGVPAPPAAATAWLVGLSDTAHPLGCVTVTVCPAIMRDPERAGPVFAAAANVTAPLPVPEEPPVIVSQGTAVVAVHAHATAVSTDTERLAAPAAGGDRLVGATA